MTDREKLIELLQEANAETAAKIEKGEIEDAKIGWEFLADHLIANGVVVREKGEWKPVKYNVHCSCGKSYGTYHYECQVCHRVSYAQPYGLNFCPNCGADMRKGENG